MKFDSMKAVILDTETTGFEEPEAIEVAWFTIDEDVMPEHDEDIKLARYKPTKPIEFGAMAAHHIFDWELDQHPPTGTFKLPPGTQFLIGHSVDFDWAVIGKPNVARICTLALAQYFWPEASSHKLSSLIYELYLREYRATGAEGVLRDTIKGAHGAKTDVLMTAMLLGKILKLLPPKIQTGEQLWEFCEMARIPTRMGFGKHKGELIKDIPYSYKTWLLKQEDVDPYLRAALLGKTRAED
jgi:exodeoxyribonuclease X